LPYSELHAIGSMPRSVVGDSASDLGGRGRALAVEGIRVAACGGATSRLKVTS
jgi:hypothetical protein